LHSNVPRGQASISALSKELGINPKTVAKWRKQATIDDLKTGPGDPRSTVLTQAVDENTARYTMLHDGIAQSVDVTVDEKGHPTEVQFQRWSNANPDGVHRLQPFGGFLSSFQEVHGFRVPMHVEAGNFFGTDAYFPFYIVDVSAVRFPTTPQ
jgi:hypothetical protein